MKAMPKPLKSLQHAKNRKNYLERILAEDPGEMIYIGDSLSAEQAVEQENRHNEHFRRMLEKEIAKCDKYIKSHA